MGGTSTDVARYAEVTIQTPQLDINTVAAGAGSMLFWQSGLLQVGHNSAGAIPGPACYGRGGPLIVTGANFLLGSIIPDLFSRPLDLEIVKQKFAEITEQVNCEKDGTEKLTAEELATDFLSVANTPMTRPIRTLSEGRGFHTSHHNLCCFGGAGGQHAVAVARDLEINLVIIPKYSSIPSAYGVVLADVTVEHQEPEAVTMSEEAFARLEVRFERLRTAGVQALIAQGFTED